MPASSPEPDPGLLGGGGRGDGLPPGPWPGGLCGIVPSSMPASSPEPDPGLLGGGGRGDGGWGDGVPPGDDPWPGESVGPPSESTGGLSSEFSL